MAPDCNQLWTSDGGGEGDSVVGRLMSPNLFFWLVAAWVKSRAERPSVSEVN